MDGGGKQAQDFHSGGLCQSFTVSSLHPITWTTLSYYKHLLCRCFFHVLPHNYTFQSLSHTHRHTHTLFTHLSYMHTCPVYTPEKVTQIIDDNPVHVQMFIAHTPTHILTGIKLGYTPGH